MPSSADGHAVTTFFMGQLQGWPVARISLDSAFTNCRNLQLDGWTTRDTLDVLAAGTASHTLRSSDSFVRSDG